MQRVGRIALLLSVLGAALLVGISSSASARSGQDRRSADVVFVNGSVLQFDKRARFAQALAVDDGRITYVGPNQGAWRLVGDDTDLVNLRGRMLMPGLGDGHLHGGGFVACDLNYQGGTVDEVLLKIKACLLRDDQAPLLQSEFLLVARNLQGASVTPGGQLTRHDLDRLSKSPDEDPVGTGTTRPIRVTNLDGHTYYLNTAAIANAGVTKDTPNPPDGTIGRDPDGTPNGFFADYSTNAGTPPPQPANATYLARKANVEEAVSAGITMWFRPGGSASDLPIWKQLADDGELDVRVNQAIRNDQLLRGATDPLPIQAFINELDALKQQYDGYRNAASPGTISVDSVKIGCDGVVEYPGLTAAMLKPYFVNTGTAENPVWERGESRGEDPSCEDARLAYTMLDKAGYSIHSHTIGNRAVRVVLDNIEAARDENHTRGRRHTLTHLAFIAPSDRKRFAQLGAIANFQLHWAGRDPFSVDATRPYVGDDVWHDMYPARDVIKAGGTVSLGSDAPVSPLVPWTEIETGVTRVNDPTTWPGYPGALAYHQRLTLLQALKAHTLNVAYQMHQEDVTGSIEVGKYADLIVLDQNLFNIAPSQISDTNALLTMTGGKVVHGNLAELNSQRPAT